MSGGGVVKNEPSCLEANIGDQRGADRKIASKVYTTVGQQTNINLLGMSASRGGNLKKKIKTALTGSYFPSMNGRKREVRRSRLP